MAVDGQFYFYLYIISCGITWLPTTTTSKIKTNLFTVV